MSLSGSYLARADAKVAFGYLRDCAVAGCLTSSQPVHVLVAGSASSKFGYSLYRNLLEILGQSPFSSCHIKLILADPNESQQTLWKGHSRLQSFRRPGVSTWLTWTLTRIPRPNLGPGFVNPVIVVSSSVPSLANLRRLCGDLFLLLLREPVAPEAFASYSNEPGATSFLATTGEFGAFSLFPGSESRETGMAFREVFESFNPLDFEALFEGEPPASRNISPGCG